jgi:tetratricopeptide (TPR) repeat protein
MAKAYFYLEYYSPEEIKKTLDMVRNPSALPGIDDRRFYGLMKIVGGDPDGGVRFLVDSADIQRDHPGKLFLASAYTLAKQYTNAIVEYKSILESSPEQQTMVKARVGLGRVYLTQQLAKEALQQFDEALRNDQQNIQAKILSARAYLSLGDKAAAKRLCSDLLSHNIDNAEIREILKVTQ